MEFGLITNLLFFLPSEHKGRSQGSWDVFLQFCRAFTTDISLTFELLCPGLFCLWVYFVLTYFESPHIMQMHKSSTNSKLIHRSSRSRQGGQSKSGRIEHGRGEGSRDNGCPTSERIICILCLCYDFCILSTSCQ